MTSRELRTKIISMNESDVSALESHITEQPDDVDSRVLLLAYYDQNYMNNIQCNEKREFYSNNVCRHLVWVINHVPESDILSELHSNSGLYPNDYQKCKAAWISKLEEEQDNTTIFGHAAAFFSWKDTQYSQRLLYKAHTLDPQSPGWPYRLAISYQLEGRQLTVPETYTQELAQKALEQFDLAFELGDTEESEYILDHVAHMALACNEIPKAEHYGNLMLSEECLASDNPGHFLYHGHQTLGRVAIAKNDIEKAKEHLIESGKTSGSNVLRSFGPDFDLAKEVLDHGEVECVLEYLSLCSNFWKMPGERINKWSQDIRETGNCDFSDSFLYEKLNED